MVYYILHTNRVNADFCDDSGGISFFREVQQVVIDARVLTKKKLSRKF